MGGYLDYIAGESILHRLNPLTKLCLSFVLCVCCFVSDSHWVVAGVMALNVLLAAVAGRPVLRRSCHMLRALVKFSLFLFVLQVLFVRDGAVLLRLPFGLLVTDLGVSFSLLFVMRLMGATMPLALVLSVTQMNDIAAVLVEKLHVPYKYSFTLMTAVRFIPIFAHEMAEIMEAQTARGVEFDTRNFFRKIRLILPLCVPLLISSVRKIESGAIAVELRGFNCRKRGCAYKRYDILPRDLLAMASGIALLAAIATL